MNKIKAIRGAVCCKNTEEDITTNVCSLFSDIINKNSLKLKNIISIQFSVTDDINILNPATALRNGFKKGIIQYDVSDIPLFCTQEAEFINSKKGIIRVLITVKTRNKKINHIYLNGAQVLRPDLQDTK